MGLRRLFGLGHDKDMPVEQWRFSGPGWLFDIDHPGIIGVRIEDLSGKANTIDIVRVKTAFETNNTKEIFPNVDTAVIADLGKALKQPRLPLAKSNYYVTETGMAYTKEM